MTLAQAMQRIEDLESKLATAEALLRKEGIYLCEHGEPITDWNRCDQCEKENDSE